MCTNTYSTLSAREKQDIRRFKNMKKSMILLAMVVMSVFFFTACGPKVASSGNAIASFGNVASGGNVASASNAG